MLKGYYGILPDDTKNKLPTSALSWEKLPKQGGYCTCFQSTSVLRNKENSEYTEKADYVISIEKSKTGFLKKSKLTLMWLSGSWKMWFWKNNRTKEMLEIDTMDSFSSPFFHPFTLSLLLDSLPFHSFTASSLSSLRHPAGIDEASLSSSHFRHGWVIEGYAWSAFDFPAAQ